MSSLDLKVGPEHYLRQALLSLLWDFWKWGQENLQGEPKGNLSVTEQRLQSNSSKSMCAVFSPILFQRLSLARGCWLVGCFFSDANKVSALSLIWKKVFEENMLNP